MYLCTCIHINLEQTNGNIYHHHLQSCVFYREAGKCPHASSFVVSRRNIHQWIFAHLQICRIAQLLNTIATILANGNRFEEYAAVWRSFLPKLKIDSSVAFAANVYGYAKSLSNCSIAYCVFTSKQFNHFRSYSCGSDMLSFHSLFDLHRTAASAQVKLISSKHQLTSFQENWTSHERFVKQ